MTLVATRLSREQYKEGDQEVIIIFLGDEMSAFY